MLYLVALGILPIEYYLCRLVVLNTKIRNEKVSLSKKQEKIFPIVGIGIILFSNMMLLENLKEAAIFDKITYSNEIVSHSSLKKRKVKTVRGSSNYKIYETVFLNIKDKRLRYFLDESDPFYFDVKKDLQNGQVRVGFRNSLAKTSLREIYHLEQEGKVLLNIDDKLKSKKSDLIGKVMTFIVGLMIGFGLIGSKLISGFKKK